jgi:hypothetical protein
LSALVVTDGQPAAVTLATAPKRPIEGRLLWQNGMRNAFCYYIQAPVKTKSSSISYSVEDQTYTIAIPSKDGSPRMAYASCNGFSSPKIMKHVAEKNHLWTEMGKKHNATPYHLLLMGGDQVYADPIWDAVRPIRDWNQLSNRQGDEAPFTEEMRTQVEGFYFDLYTERWSQPEVKYMMARVPMLAMWDDHDIFDGWGSYAPERQMCDVFQGIRDIARKAFSVFQQHIGSGDVRPGALAPLNGFSFGYIIGKVAILALDMRNERSNHQVLSLEHWGKVYEWIDNLENLDHLFIMSSIPVVYPGFDTFERVLGVIPKHQEYEDDLRDHWNSRRHKGERIRLVHRLFTFTQSRNIRATIISGDVHVAAVGVIESIRHGSIHSPLVINQLISSAIVHPGPGPVFVFGLNHVFDSSDEIDRGIVARMMEFPGNTAKFIGNRNFLSLEPDASRRIWANWIVEGEEEDPYTKVIHPVQKVESHQEAQAA